MSYGILLHKTKADNNVSGQVKKKTRLASKRKQQKSSF